MKRVICTAARARFDVKNTLPAAARTFHYHMQMGAKNLKVGFVTEVAPPPILRPHKPSLSPRLETIQEEKAEGCDEDLCLTN